MGGRGWWGDRRNDLAGRDIIHEFYSGCFAIHVFDQSDWGLSCGRHRCCERARSRNCSRGNAGECPCNELKIPSTIRSRLLSLIYRAALQLSDFFAHGEAHDPAARDRERCREDNARMTPAVAAPTKALECYKPRLAHLISRLFPVEILRRAMLALFKRRGFR